MREQISSRFICLKKANEEATFLRSWILGKEPGSAILMNLQTNHLSLLIGRSDKSDGFTKSLIDGEFSVSFKKVHKLFTGQSG